MKRLSAVLLLTGILALVCACAARDPAGSSPELVLRYAENQPEDYPTTRAAHYFADLVEQRTQGRIRVRVYADGELGDEVSVLEQMSYGGIDLARASLSTLMVECPTLMVLQLPYLY